MAVGSAFVIYIVGAVAVDLVWQGIAPGTFTSEGLTVGIVSYQFLALGTAISVVLLVRTRGATLGAIGFRFPGWEAILMSALVVIPVFVGVALIYSLFSTFDPGYHLHGNAQELLSGTTGHLTVTEKIALFIFAAVEAPITEETLFRGILFQGVRQLFSRWVPFPVAVASAAVVSGALFGFLHFEPQTLPILIFLGIVLASVFQFTRSLYGSMTVHAIVNAIAVISLIQSS